MGNKPGTRPMFDSSARLFVTYAAFVSLIILIVSDAWLHLPLYIMLPFALMLAIETCWSIWSGSEI